MYNNTRRSFSARWPGGQGPCSVLLGPILCTIDMTHPHRHTNAHQVRLLQLWALEDATGPPHFAQRRVGLFTFQARFPRGCRFNLVTAAAALPRAVGRGCHAGFDSPAGLFGLLFVGGLHWFRLRPTCRAHMYASCFPALDMCTWARARHLPPPGARSWAATLHAQQRAGGLEKRVNVSTCCWAPVHGQTTCKYGDGMLVGGCHSALPFRPALCGG